MTLHVHDGFRDIPAFEFLDGDTGAGVRGIATRLEVLAGELLQAGSGDLPAAGAGVTVTRAIEILGETRQNADRATERHLRIAAALAEAARAAEAFLKTSPTDAEITEAEATFDAASAALAAAARSGSSRDAPLRRLRRHGSASAT